MLRAAQPFALTKPEDVLRIALRDHGKRLSDQDIGKALARRCKATLCSRLIRTSSFAFLTRDHEALARRALEIVANNDVFVPVTVILEAEWVLRDAYEIAALDEVIRELQEILRVASA